MTRDEAKRVTIGDVILVGVRKDRPAVVSAFYPRGVAPVYRTAEDVT